MLTLDFLLGCVAWLQIIAPGMLVRQGDMRSLHIQEVPTPRGIITDRSDRPLAVNISVKAVWANPKEVHDAGDMGVGERWRASSTALNLPLNQLVPRINVSPKRRFTYLTCRVNPNVVDYIKKLKLPGTHLREESRHYYPSRGMTVHPIGFTNVDSQGIEDAEKSFDRRLTGQPDERIVCKDRYDRIIKDISPTDSQAVHNPALSIDERLQALAYRELNNVAAFNKAESGNVMLVDVDVDEVLAMTNSLSYSSNSLTGTPRDVMRNRTIADVLEPGSTVKPMVVMTALQRGVVRENTILNTTLYRINGHEIKDVARYNELTLAGALWKSSNVGASGLILAMPSSVLVDTYSYFGLGKATNSGLVGECSGLYPRKQRWSDIGRAIFSFGYGLMITSLQLTQVYVTVGSYGVYCPLSVAKVGPPVLGERVFSGGTIRTVMYMMENMALPGDGSVKAAIKGYRIAIKTDTVKKVGPDGCYINKHIAYAVDVAPASQLHFALVVVINDPQTGKYYGGTISTLVFGAVMGGVLYIMSIESDTLITGNKSEFVNNQGGTTGGRL